MSVLTAAVAPIDVQVLGGRAKAVASETRTRQAWDRASTAELVTGAPGKGRRRPGRDDPVGARRAGGLGQLGALPPGRSAALDAPVLLHSSPAARPRPRPPSAPACRPSISSQAASYYPGTPPKLPSGAAASDAVIPVDVIPRLSANSASTGTSDRRASCVSRARSPRLLSRECVERGTGSGSPFQMSLRPAAVPPPTRGVLPAGAPAEAAAAAPALTSRCRPADSPDEAARRRAGARARNPFRFTRTAPPSLMPEDGVSGREPGDPAWWRGGPLGRLRRRPVFSASLRRSPRASVAWPS